MSNCCGEINLVAGTPVVVDPAACNALTNSPSGLLVPSIDLLIDNSAVVPPTSATRSIDLDLIEAGGCPNSFTIGARLSPVFGQTEMTTTFLAPLAINTYIDIPGGTIVLPEAGTYEVASEVRGAMAPSVDTPNSSFAIGRLVNVTAGAPIALTERLIIGGSILSNVSLQATAPQTTFITVAVPTTIQFQAMWTGLQPSAGSGIYSDVNGRSMLRFKKVAD